ncbi:MAG: FAD-binding oxidoreductase [Alphaproteobacteria bacterium]
MTDTATQNITVVGAGIVGMSCARWLQRDGHKITVIDPVPPGESCSFGNAGIISYCAMTPLATPGMVWKALGWMFDPMGPFTVRWSYMPIAAPWLLRLLANSRPSRVEAISDALRVLNKPTLDNYRELFSAEDFNDLIRLDGSINAYETEAELAADQASWDLRERYGYSAHRLGRDELRQMEPDISPHIACAVYTEETAHVVNPGRVVTTLADRFLADGGEIIAQRVEDFDVGPDGPRALFASGERRPVETLVIAAGAWSHRLAAKLGSRVPLEAERGYHMVVPDPGVDVRRPVTLASGKFYATPMETGLRIAGTVEIAGVDAEPNFERARALLEHGRNLYPGLKTDGAIEWSGCRPSLPDSLPVIGRSPRHDNVYYAFGHGHLGLTEGGFTGKLIAEQIAGKPTSIDLTPYRADRF